MNNIRANESMTVAEAKEFSEVNRLVDEKSWKRIPFDRWTIYEHYKVKLRLENWPPFVYDMYLKILCNTLKV